MSKRKLGAIISTDMKSGFCVVLDHCESLSCLYTLFDIRVVFTFGIYRNWMFRSVRARNNGRVVISRPVVVSRDLTRFEHRSELAPAAADYHAGRWLEIFYCTGPIHPTRCTAQIHCVGYYEHMPINIEILTALARDDIQPKP